jgi:hypothetical protein
MLPIGKAGDVMPTFGGVTGRVYCKAWRVPALRTAAVVFLHGFGKHPGLYRRLRNALNGAGIDCGRSIRAWLVRKFQSATPARYCTSFLEKYCQFLIADVA